MQKPNKTINILMLGLTAEDSEPVMSLLHSARLAPRSALANDSEELLSALKERSWDLILFNQNSPVTLNEVETQLKAANRDTPLILLAPDASAEHQIEGLKRRASAIVPIDQKELLAMVIRRELNHLENRRRRRWAERLLIDTEKRLRDLLHTSTDAIAYINKAHELIYLNPACHELFGYQSSNELLGSVLETIVVSNDKDNLHQFLNDYQQNGKTSQALNLKTLRADGSQLSAQLQFSTVRFDDTLNTQVIFQKAHLDTEMENLVEQDIVTGLKNRTYLEKMLDQSVESAVHNGNYSHLLYINLDQFSVIKSELGVKGTDTLARDVANLLKALVNRAHVLTRCDLNAFAVIFSDEDSDKALELGEQIRGAVESHLTETPEATIQSTCSIGITPITENSPNAKEVLRMAQSASDSVRSKNQTGNGVQLYKPDELEEESSHSVETLRQAIDENRFKLLFQPVVGLMDNTHEHLYEVLLRLIDTDNNEVSPNIFLTTVDHTEISTQLDRWVIRESIRQLAIEHHKGLKNKLFINLTGRSLADPRLLQWISDQLNEYSLPGDCLIFQFSESDASTQLKYANIFTQGLVQLHASACIKHFGSSIDSEHVLKQVPAQFIKLDGSFVQELENSAMQECFKKLMEPLTDSHKTVIAPLVEDTSVMSKLWSAGVHYIQGYYLQAPREKMDYDFFTQD